MTTIIKQLVATGLMFMAVQSFADRPAMSGQPAASNQPVMDNHAAPNRPSMNEIPAQETVLPAPVQEPNPAPRAVVPEPPVQAVTTEIGTVLEMQPGETLPVTLLDFPKRGMTMDKVQNELGRPIEISSTVGSPPITSWAYDDRVVYFEHAKVIHVVSSR